MRRETLAVRVLAVLVLIPATLFPGEFTPAKQPSTAAGSRPRWQPATMDPTIPLVTTFASRGFALPRPLIPLRAYRFGDSTVLQFNDDLEADGRGALPNVTRPGPPPERDK